MTKLSQYVGQNHPSVECRNLKCAEWLIAQTEPPLKKKSAAGQPLSTRALFVAVRLVWLTLEEWNSEKNVTWLGPVGVSSSALCFHLWKSEWTTMEVEVEHVEENRHGRSACSIMFQHFPAAGTCRDLDFVDDLKSIAVNDFSLFRMFSIDHVSYGQYSWLITINRG